MTWPPPPPPPPPPPLPYGHSGYPPPPPPKKKRTGLIIALSVVGVLVVLGVVAVLVAGVVFKDRVGATDIALGSCIADVPDSSRVATLPTVDCAEPHGGEVYAVLTIPGEDYPGESVMNEWQSKCPDALASFSPAAAQDAGVGIYVLYPTKETWADGDRVITCVATLKPKRTGSLKQ